MLNYNLNIMLQILPSSHEDFSVMKADKIN